MKPWGMSFAQRLSAGDPSSYEELLDGCSEDILRLANLILRDADEARDVLQESVLRLIRQAREGRLRSVNGSIPGFLIVTARNQCIDRIKKRMRLKPIEDEEESRDCRFADWRTPSVVAFESQFEEAFGRALDRLNPIQRAILVLRELNGESPADIAQSLGLSVENVRMHLCRARKKMREILEPFVEEP